MSENYCLLWRVKHLTRVLSQTGIGGSPSNLAKFIAEPTMESLRKCRLLFPVPQLNTWHHHQHLFKTFPVARDGTGPGKISAYRSIRHKYPPPPWNFFIANQGGGYLLCNSILYDFDHENYYKKPKNWYFGRLTRGGGYLLCNRPKNWKNDDFGLNKGGGGGIYDEYNGRDF